MKTDLIITTVAVFATTALLCGAISLSLLGCGDDEQTYTGHAIVGYVTDADTGKPLPSRRINVRCVEYNSHWGNMIYLGNAKTNAEGDYVFPDPAYEHRKVMDIVLSHLGHRLSLECESGGGYKNQYKTIQGFGKAGLPERVDFQLEPEPTE